LSRTAEGVRAIAGRIDGGQRGVDIVEHRGISAEHILVGSALERALKLPSPLIWRRAALPPVGEGRGRGMNSSFGSRRSATQSNSPRDAAGFAA